MEDVADATLVKWVRMDNKEAFRQLIERHQIMALCLAVRFTRNEEIACELVQEAMLQAYLSLDKLHEEARFKSWFYGITLNICRSWLRAQKDETLSLDTQEGSKLLEQSSWLIQDPQEHLARHELHHLVQEAVRMLPAPNRQVAYLFYYEEMSMQEIAQQLHLSVPAVKNRLYKGRNQLRNHLKALYPDGLYNTSAKSKRAHGLQALWFRVVHPGYARADLQFLFQKQQKPQSHTSVLPLLRQTSTPAGAAKPSSTRRDGSEGTNNHLQKQRSSINTTKGREKEDTMQHHQQKPLHLYSWIGLILIGLLLALGLTRLDKGQFAAFFGLALVAWLIFCVGIKALVRWLLSTPWAAALIMGLPLVIGLTQLYASDGSKQRLVFGLALVGWLAFCLVIRVPARWLRQNTTLHGATMFLVAIPLAILLFIGTNTFHIGRNLGIDDSISLFISYAFLSAWSVVSIHSMRTARNMYYALHLINWLFWLGMVSALAPWGIFSVLWLGMTGPISLQAVLFLAFPLSIMLVLFDFYKPIVQHQAPFFWFQMSSAVPKSDDHSDYEQGYRPSYEEDEKIYTYTDRHEEPVAGYPWGSGDSTTMPIIREYKSQENH